MRKTQILVCAVLMLSTLGSFSLINHIPEEQVSIFVGAALLITHLAGCLWVYFDAEEIDFSGRYFWCALVLVAAPLTLPVYFLVSRGAAGVKEIFGLVLLVGLVIALSYGIRLVWFNSGFIDQIPKALDENFKGL